MDLEKKEVLSELKDYYSFFINTNDEVIISQKNKFTFLNRNNPNDNQNITKFSCRNILNIKDNKYVLCDENGLYYCQLILHNNIDSSFNLDKISYRGGIELTDEIIGATSNRILSKGENKLIFFSSTSKIFKKGIEVNNYSFTLSLNNCALMGIPNKDNCKLLLFACKKYRKDDKNGILLLKIKLINDDGEKFEKFYDTKNFEVYCFCPIFELKEKTILEKNDKSQAKETEYFFVGGFDLDKNKGLIKLYKVIYNVEIEKIEIEYIQDIIVENKIRKEDSEYFKEPISCIFQSSSREILVTCYDGNIYYFSEPNFSLLNQDYNTLK